jgi:hypothetical protein
MKMIYAYRIRELERFVQLHENVRIIYIVDGYQATLETRDGNIDVLSAEAETIPDALAELGLLVSEKYTDVYEMRRQAIRKDS